MAFLGWFRRGRSTQVDRTDGPSMTVDQNAVKEHLRGFAQTRRGVEGFVEPATNVSAESLILIASSGEWTRRAVGSRKTAFDIARSLEIPVYDVLLTGYPSRMREWNSQQRRRDPS